MKKRIRVNPRARKVLDELSRLSYEYDKQRRELESLREKLDSVSELGARMTVHISYNANTLVDLHDLYYKHSIGREIVERILQEGDEKLKEIEGSILTLYTNNQDLLIEEPTQG